MQYASVSVITEGFTPDDYRAVSRILGDKIPEDLVVEFAAEGDGGLHVISVWGSKEEHDTFMHDRLIPAFQAANLRPGHMSITELEIGESVIGNLSTSIAGGK